MVFKYGKAISHPVTQDHSMLREWVELIRAREYSTSFSYAERMSSRVRSMSKYHTCVLEDAAEGNVI
jgi:hypothetical protein